MINNSSSETRNNKKFIINNSSLLQKFAQKHQEYFGFGIIVINLLQLKTENINESDLLDQESSAWQEPTVHQPVSFIPKDNFWFKMINLKIQKKHQIDLQAQNDTDKIFVVFIKDDAMEHFSIYTIKGGKKYETLHN